MVADKTNKGNKSVSVGLSGYADSDLHSGVAIGGMRLGQSFVFVAAQAMPQLSLEQIGQACDALAKGQDTYRSLLLLHRLRPIDIPLIWQATVSEQLQIRWERLWILSPFLNRLIRAPESQKLLLEQLRGDVPALHLLSKFAEQSNHAVRRIFARLQGPLVAFLCEQVIKWWGNDQSQFQQVAAILATLETDEEKLRAALLLGKGKAEQVESILNRLYIRYNNQHGGRLSSKILRDKLQSWRR